jgi:putative phage-type endonuclease
VASDSQFLTPQAVTERSDADVWGQPWPPPDATRRVMPAAVRIAPAARGTGEPHPELRRRGIGGSDMAAITGLGDAGKTALDVYLDKKGIGGQRRSPALDEAAQFGHLMEDVIAREFGRRSGLRLLPSPGMLANSERPWLLANLDRVVTDVPDGRVPLSRRYPLEIKMRSAYQAAQWGDDPADAPAIQLQHYLAVTGAAKGYLAALIGGNHLVWYEVPRDEELIGLLIDAAEEFRRCLADDDPPPPDGSAHTSALLSSIWGGDPASIMMATPAQAESARVWADLYRTYSGQARWNQEAADEAANNIKMLMGDAVALMDGIKVLATWKRNGTFRAKEFREDHPGVAGEYAKPSAAIDTTRLADDHPDLYAQYRARVFRPAG